VWWFSVKLLNFRKTFHVAMLDRLKNQLKAVEGLNIVVCVRCGRAEGGNVSPSGRISCVCVCFMGKTAVTPLCVSQTDLIGCAQGQISWTLQYHGKMSNNYGRHY